MDRHQPGLYLNQVWFDGVISVELAIDDPKETLDLADHVLLR